MKSSNSLLSKINYLMVLFLFLIIILYSQPAYSQQSKIDSLKQLVKDSEGNDKLHNLTELTYELYLAREYDNALEIANSTYRSALRQKNIEIQSKILEYIAEIYYDLNENLKSIDFLKKSIKLKKELGDQQGESYCLNVIGILYRKQYSYDKALEYHTESLKIARLINNKRRMSNALYSIGRIYHDLKNVVKALEYYEQSLSIEKELGNLSETAAALDNIGIIYSTSKDSKKALEYYNKSLDIYNQLNDDVGLSRALHNIGMIYFRDKDYKKALEYTERSFEIEKKLSNNDEGKAWSLNTFGDIYYEMGKLNESINSQLKSLELTNDLELQNKIYDSLAKAYSYKNDFRSAYNYIIKYNNTKDSLFNEQSAIDFAEIQTRYETERQEHENKLLKQENYIKDLEISRSYYLRNFLLVSIILILFIATFYLYQYRLKKKENKVINEKNILITEQKNKLAKTLSDLKLTQNQLIESEKMASLGSLVAGVAHEINTPVGILITASTSLNDNIEEIAELMQENKLTKSDFKKYLQLMYETTDLISSNSNRAGELISSFKRVAVDRQNDLERVFDLKSYINELILSLKPLFKGKNIEITLNSDKCEISSFPGAFAQIFTNLIQNSMIHGFEKRNSGTIKIDIIFENILKIAYKDNGSGIDEKVLSKIFDPFVSTNRQKGSGLGLNIVYNIVTQKLKGNISVNSKPEDYTEFILEFPYLRKLS